MRTADVTFPDRQKAARALLAEAIAASGLSARAYAEQVLVRDERTVRRWQAGDIIPAIVVRWLEAWKAGQAPAAS